MDIVEFNVPYLYETCDGPLEHLGVAPRKLTHLLQYLNRRWKKNLKLKRCLQICKCTCTCNYIFPLRIWHHKKATFIPAIFLSRIKDYMEPMMTFTAWAKNYITKHFLQCKGTCTWYSVGGLGKKFCPAKLFSAIYTVPTCSLGADTDIYCISLKNLAWK